MPAFCTGNVGQTTGVASAWAGSKVQEKATGVVLSITLLLPLLSASHCVCTSPFCFFCQEGYIVKDKGRCPHFSQCASVFGLGTEMSLGLGL